jgi:hypothetical protein
MGSGVGKGYTQRIRCLGRRAGERVYAEDSAREGMGRYM